MRDEAPVRNNPQTPASAPHKSRRPLVATKPPHTRTKTTTNATPVGKKKKVRSRSPPASTGRVNSTLLSNFYYLLILLGQNIGNNISFIYLFSKFKSEKSLFTNASFLTRGKHRMPTSTSYFFRTKMLLQFVLNTVDQDHQIIGWNTSRLKHSKQVGSFPLIDIASKLK